VVLTVVLSNDSSLVFTAIRPTTLLVTVPFPLPKRRPNLTRRAVATTALSMGTLLLLAQGPLLVALTVVTRNTVLSSVLALSARSLLPNSRQALMPSRWG